MMKKILAPLLLSISLSLSVPVVAHAEIATVHKENCGAYVYRVRPVDCGEGRYFVILVGANTLNESNVILNPGYDYAYTFDVLNYARPWGTVPELVNVNGVWAIPENQASLPEGTQPTMQIVLKTSYKTMDTDKRYVDVVHLPGNVDPFSLPGEVRKYAINTTDPDIDYSAGVNIAGWETVENGKKKYRNVDGTYVTNAWMTLGDKTYYLDENGILLTDAFAPDGTYVNAAGEKVAYKPGWYDDEKGRHYVLKNGKFAGATWIKDEDGKQYYINIGTLVEKDTITPDGYYVDANGVWDGNPSVKKEENQKSLGPAAVEGWEETSDGWKYKQLDKTYLTNSWKESDGKWYYLGADGIMLTNTTTPDGYYVDENGVWVQNEGSNESSEENSAEDTAEAEE